MKKPKITIKKLEERYTISDGLYTISVIIKPDGMSIYRKKYFNTGFEFENSNPDLVRGVANLMLEAVKLYNSLYPKKIKKIK